jgi:hypothetical protein
LNNPYPKKSCIFLSWKGIYWFINLLFIALKIIGYFEVTMQVGILAGYDIGRVWVNDLNSDKWHDDYGVGAWLNLADLASGTLNLFHSDDGLWFTFGLSSSF